MLPQPLNENQLRLLTNYVSTVVHNNQEINVNDMPPVIEMFKAIADRNYYVTHDQIDAMCEELHSLANDDPTSESLIEFLKRVASTFHFYALYHSQHLQPLKRPISSIANDIITENDVGYSETS